MAAKTKLELTWIGKDNRPRLEPRILIEEPEFSHHASAKREGDIFDNMLIHGDNLLALKALETDVSIQGRVKCIYIDPPYNTGSAFEHYDDGLEHSAWLSLIRERVIILRNLLAENGLFFAQIDDNEFPYFAVMLDEIFGRNNRVNVVAVKMSEASGVKMSHVDKKLPKLKEYILIYRKKETPPLTIEKTPVGAWNDEYKTIVHNVSEEELETLKSIIDQDFCSQEDVDKCNEIIAPAVTQSLSSYFKEMGIKAKDQEAFKFDNAWRIIQAVGSSSVLNLAKSLPRQSQEISAGLSARGLVYLYKTDFDGNAKQPRIQVIFADANLLRNPGDFWTDIKTTGGVGQEGGVLFPNGKKPEALIKRVIGMCTKPGDLVLDSFAGSGTTGAVAHKMGRRWIMVELGEHAKTHIVPRMQKVLGGTDKGGVTEATDWKGGGGYRFFRLAPSLLHKDVWGNWVISKDYNAEMLAEAMCKHFNYVYAPSTEAYWMHGQASENAFIYVTTASLTIEQLRAISDEVGEDRSLLICCMAYEAQGESLSNLTLKKIPRVVLDRCEWGQDDYSLKINALPMAEDEPDDIDDTPAPKRSAKAKAADTPDLFGAEED
ncbi:site-specific DNA-methyltransferase [Paracoccus marcusii]|uniref:site-specific DNA-methyltransferase n=1 Tax=Paracoccus marcusii TaxID=59779 RepID=UPI0035A5A796